MTGRILTKFKTKVKGTKLKIMKALYEEDLPWKKTSTISRKNFSATTGQILPKFETKATGTKLRIIKSLNEDDLL